MHCVLVDPYATRNAHRLRALGTPWTIDCVSRTDPYDQLTEALGAADAVVAQGWDAAIARCAPDLGLLQLPNTGTEAVDWSAVPERCVVANTYEHEIPVAEFVMLAMLESRIGIRELDRCFRGGDWSMSHRAFGPTHGELAGATLGLIGYGHIGKAVAIRARTFGVNVVAVSRRRPDDASLLDWSGDMQALDAMLPRCDFLVIGCPLTPETRSLIDARRLALLPGHATVINVARGEIIDEAALFAALESGSLAAAALDVWWRYPTETDVGPSPSRFPFDRLPNVLMTPHVSAWTEPMLDRRWNMIAANLDRYERGMPLLNVVERRFLSEVKP